MFSFFDYLNVNQKLENNQNYEAHAHYHRFRYCFLACQYQTSRFVKHSFMLQNVEVNKFVGKNKRFKSISTEQPVCGVMNAEKEQFLVVCLCTENKD
jgi:hypothetical protein